MKKTSNVINRPLSGVKEGEFFYHNNKRYVLLEHGDSFVKAIRVNGSTVKIKNFGEYIKQYE